MGKVLTAVQINSISIPSYSLQNILRFCDKHWNIYSPGISSPTGSTWQYAGATLVTFLCHPYFKKASGGRVEPSLLTQNTNEPRKWTPGNWSDKTSEHGVEKECSLKARAMFGEIIVLLRLIQIFASPLPLPYLAIVYQSTACHVCDLSSFTWELEVTMHDSSLLTNGDAICRKVCDLWSRILSYQGEKNTSPLLKYLQDDGGRGERDEGERRLWEKLLVYHPAWCLDEEIPCSGRGALDKTRLLPSLCCRSLSQPAVISIPIHLVWVMRAAGEPSRSLKPLLTQRRRSRVACEVTGARLL